jgi:glycosyltransferase involved in cell wall biosynthesis
VDVDVFTPRAVSERDGLGCEDLVVGTVAANSPRKKLGAVIEAFGLLAEELPDARLVIKTDRVVSHEGFDLAARAARTGVAGRVTLIEDELSDLELARLYRGLSVYVNLSEWEGFCIPVAEAMSCGVPVACQPGQGPGEIVPYRDLLVPGGEQVRDNGSVLVQPDPACAAEVILKAFRCPGLLERLSEQGRQEAVRIYSIREAARSWLSFIDSQGRHI